MNKIKIICTAMLMFCIFKTNAQCSDVSNNFELQLIQISKNELKLNLRFSTSEVLGDKKSSEGKMLLDGLVFAIASPANSNVEIVTCKSSLQPFQLKIDNSLNNHSSLSKATEDYITTIFHDGGMPIEFGNTFENDKWYEIAIITFEGVLSNNEAFSLLNCDYGLAHPNSYVGNSTTDPWLAIFDDSNNYYQFSPKISTSNTLVESKVKVFPNPTTDRINIELTSNSSSQVIVQVFDMSGKVVSSIYATIHEGLNTINLNLENIVAGTYNIKIADGKTIAHSVNVIKK